MSIALWILDTSGNVFLFAYIGVLAWLYFRAEDDER